AIDEALEIGRAGNAPVHIFHLKAAGRQNWGKMQLAIARIKAARAEGRQVTADIYPYINNGLGAAAFIHPRHFAEGREKLIRRLDDQDLRNEIRTEMETTGGWENWYRHCGNDWNKVVIGQCSDERYAPHVGQSVAAIAQAVNEDPWDTFFNLVRSGAFALPESMTDANKILAMQQEFVSFCTDVGPAGGSRIASHPRAFGAFPRLLSHYVRDLGAISLERAIAQASAVAANDVLAYDRGRIAENLAADIIVFDYEKLTDKATFSQPNELSEGMKFVIVNGELVLKDGKLTDKLPGRILRGPGYRNETAPHQVSTGPEPGISEFDSAMQGYMRKHRIPGGSLAVTFKGRLVHARGYGYADVGTKEQVTPTSLFRIASISKPITAVAILQLIEQDKLSLDDKVYDLLDFAQFESQTPKFDERLKEITIRHLLEHRGGWDRDQSFDAMFRAVQFAEELGTPPPAGPAEIIRVMFGQKLDFTPGERYAYSNYGYCLLGRVIEKLTGQTYEEYTKQRVLTPAGIGDMTIGHPRLSGRFPHEVRYYHPGQGKSVYAVDVGQSIPWPYGGWHHEAMDSHGAWIASAVDLARFAVALDDPEQSKLISPESLELMHVRPPGLAGHNEDDTPKESYYSFGWSNRSDGNGQWHHSHSGSLPGTATILVRRADGVNFAALFNSRTSPYASHFGRGIESILHETVDKITDWPDHDLFNEFQE
ncbi:MAG TPA: serine hydrolase, partial [Planctomycetaceae bacterium]|nr:serine hydrolase [Planctomycetaceae bacterium]